jgi:hypothetical protein
LTLAEDELGVMLRNDVPADVLDTWMQACAESHRPGLSFQEWLSQNGLSASLCGSLAQFYPEDSSPEFPQRDFSAATVRLF